MRQIVLDTETTGLNPDAGHRIVEIGCVEIQDRLYTGRTFQKYLNPDRDIDEAAQDIHGLTAEFLADKPRFLDIADELKGFLDGAELLIHNAAFDVSFLDAEFQRLDIGYPGIAKMCTVTDTLEMARRQYPGQSNSLDALCKRLAVDNTGRDLHGALLDAQLLAEVYLAMTGGQVSLKLDGEARVAAETSANQAITPRGTLPRVIVNVAERDAHQQRLRQIRDKVGYCVWDRVLGNYEMTDNRGSGTGTQ